MLLVTATEFIKNFGRHNLDAQREPIAVTSHGRVTGYYVSAHEFETMQKKIESMPQSYTLKTLPDALWKAFMESSADEKQEHLDALPDDAPEPETR